MMSTELNYIGDELTIFAFAKNWKAYFAAELTPFIRARWQRPARALGQQL